MRNRGGHTRRRRVLSVEEWTALTPEQQRWHRALGYLAPMAGAEEGEGEGAGGEGSGFGSGEGSGEGSGSGEGEGEGAGSGSGEGEGEGEGGGSREGEGSGRGSGSGSQHPDDVLELKRSEVERLRRIAREKEQADKRADAERKKAIEKQRREQGQYEELLKEKDEAIASVERDRDEARYKLDRFQRELRVSQSAVRLGYKDPDDAIRFLTDADTEDDVSTERALKSLSKKKPYLVNERRATGAPVNGEGGTLTKADIENMSPEEIIKNWDRVSAAMAGGL